VVDHDDIYDDHHHHHHHHYDSYDDDGCGFADKSCGDDDQYIYLSIHIQYLSIHQSIHLYIYAIYHLSIPII